MLTGCSVIESLVNMAQLLTSTVKTLLLLAVRFF